MPGFIGSLGSCCTNSASPYRWPWGRSQSGHTLQPAWFSFGPLCWCRCQDTQHEETANTVRAKKYYVITEIEHRISTFLGGGKCFLNHSSDTSSNTVGKRALPG
eukprot:6023158-Amphidinium_carterae.3